MTPAEGEALEKFLRRNADYTNRRLEFKPIAGKANDVALTIHRRGKGERTKLQLDLELAYVSDAAETAFGRQLREDELQIDYQVISRKPPSRGK